MVGMKDQFIKNKPEMPILGPNMSSEDGLYNNNNNGNFMPSNLSGFYMPYITANNEALDQYGYDINIQDKNSSPEESKLSRKPPLRRTVIQEQEDDLAQDIEESKPHSRSPVARQSSIERHTNGSFVNKLPMERNRSNNPGRGTLPQHFTNYDPRHEEQRVSVFCVKII